MFARLPHSKNDSLARPRLSSGTGDRLSPGDLALPDAVVEQVLGAFLVVDNE
jgi:hypothetical protein